MSTDIINASSHIIDDRNLSLSVVSNRQTPVEDLADYIRRVRNEKGLSLRDVEIKSGLAISKGYIGQIENRIVLGHSVTPQKLQALSRGLGVSEDEIFAIARGKSHREPEMPAEFAVLFYGWEEATDEQKAETLAAIRMIAESFQRRRERGPQKTKGSNGTAKKKK